MKVSLAFLVMGTLFCSAAWSAESQVNYVDPAVGIFLTNVTAREALTSLDSLGGHYTARLFKTAVQKTDSLRRHVCLEYNTYGSDVVMTLGSISGDIVYTPMIPDHPQTGVWTSVENVKSMRHQRCEN